MNDTIKSFLIGALFSTIVTLAIVYKFNKANAGNEHYMLTPSECLTWHLQAK